MLVVLRRNLVLRRAAITHTNVDNLFEHAWDVAITVLFSITTTCQSFEYGLSVGGCNIGLRGGTEHMPGLRVNP